MWYLCLLSEFVHVLFASEGYMFWSTRLVEVGGPVVFSAVHSQMPSVFIAVSAWTWLWCETSAYGSHDAGIYTMAALIDPGFLRTLSEGCLWKLKQIWLSRERPKWNSSPVTVCFISFSEESGKAHLSVRAWAGRWQKEAALECSVCNWRRYRAYWETTLSGFWNSLNDGRYWGESGQGRRVLVL